jgi:hypothetical protein
MKLHLQADSQHGFLLISDSGQCIKPATTWSWMKLAILFGYRATSDGIDRAMHHLDIECELGTTVFFMVNIYLSDPVALPGPLNHL